MALNRLKTARRSRGIKQAEMAALLNVTQSTYSYWENGRTPIPEYALEAMAERFGLNIEEFYQDDKPNQIKLTKLQERMLQILDELDESRKKQALEYALFLTNRQRLEQRNN